MAFGSIMRIQVNGMIIELAPLDREVMSEFIKPGVQSLSITKYMLTQAKVLEDEYEWYERTRTDKRSIVWGVWVIDGDERRLIGTSGLHDIEKEFFFQATSGSLIFDRDYWGKGIASAIHRVRTWYAFHQLGMDRILSEVLHGNTASRRALEKTGYVVTHVQRNFKFVDGRLHHMDHLECINPNTSAWKRWWGDDRPTKAAKEARIRARAAMEWASINVTLV